MIEYTIKEKLVIIAILILIMEADGIIDPNETQYLDTIINEFKLNHDQLNLLSDIDFNAIIKIFKQFELEKQKHAIQLFKGMAACDGYVDPRELSIIDCFDLQ